MQERAFLLNEWYVCARSPEIKTTPVARKVCATPLALYRRPDGAVVAMDDRCPHRKYPLSQGAVHGDAIECGYHGLRFASDGRCVLVPEQEDIPAGFAARVFPSVERASLVYVFMGDPSKADASRIPDFVEESDPAWEATPDRMLLEANWRLVLDNLLDLTHLTFSARAANGSHGSKPAIDIEGDRVVARREIFDVEPAPIFRAVRHFEGRIDRWQTVTFAAPSHVHVQLDARSTGHADDPDTLHHVVIGHVTPETATTTHFFWSVARRVRLNDPVLTDLLHRMNHTAFETDAAILREQQKMMQGAPDDEPRIALAEDAAIVAARDILRRRFIAEAVEPNL